MTYSDVIYRYVTEYEIKAYRSFPARGEKSLNTKILIYLLRVHYNLKFRELGDIALISRQCANYYYYSILRNEDYRNEAHSRWQEMIECLEHSPGWMKPNE